MSKIYDEYAILNSKIESLEAEKTIMRPKVLQQILEDGEDQIITALGRFSVTRKKVWTYDPAVIAKKEAIASEIKELSEDIKIIEDRAKKSGKATATETENFSFTGINI